MTAKNLELILTKRFQSPDETFLVLSQTREARLGGGDSGFFTPRSLALSLGSDTHLPDNTGVCAAGSKGPVIALTPEALGERQWGSEGPFEARLWCGPATGVRAT